MRNWFLSSSHSKGFPAGELGPFVGITRKPQLSSIGVYRLRAAALLDVSFGSSYCYFTFVMCSYFSRQELLSRSSHSNPDVYTTGNTDLQRKQSRKCRQFPHKTNRTSNRELDCRTILWRSENPELNIALRLSYSRPPSVSAHPITFPFSPRSTTDSMRK